MGFIGQTRGRFTLDFTDVYGAASPVVHSDSVVSNERERPETRVLAVRCSLKEEEESEIKRNRFFYSFPN